MNSPTKGLQARCKPRHPPIVGRVHEDAFTLDVRTLLESDLSVVAAALKTA